ncbi:hypothetical protein QA645_11155 [Bradyrhizobium sp. CIAT3101]|uniref:hypothetical protein n=1 Tax=Bradyrhizobium sp. CIAT3101 TaxID=439387 RepID=UPI0024B1E2B8|nr:hypothetical protein [Bradyrhizobium sp. CIAT3101]WFU83268.1 hypothetical protein QA645_11155 [Bradyrhizobium sp. CIAT3101]
MSDCEDLGEPTRSEVREKMLALLGDDTQRQRVADWAAQWVRRLDPGIEDAKVWSAIISLSGADLRTSPDEYLHGDEDFASWLRDLGDS